MAYRILNGLEVTGATNLQKYELQNARIQNLASNPIGPAVGQLYYNTNDNEIRVYNGTSWVNIGGDITGITAGTGLTGGGSAGTPTLNVVGGTGITANANDIQITDGGVGTTQLAAGGVALAKMANIAENTFIARKSSSAGTPEAITAAEARTILNVADGSNNYSLPTASASVLGGIKVGTNLSIASGVLSSTDTNTQLSTEQVQDIVGAMLTGNTETNIAVTYQDGDGTIDFVSTDTTYSAGDGLDLTSTEFEVDSTVVRTSGAQSIAGVKTFSGNMILSGNLTVNGTTTTVNSNTVNIGDNIIVLNSDEAGTPSQDGGVEIERGTSANVLLTYKESTDRWQFTNDGSTYYNIPISTEYTNTVGTVTSVAATAGTGISVSGSPITTSGTITVTNTDKGSSQNIFKNLATASGTAVADTNNDTATFANGTGISMSASADTITVTNTAPDQTVALTQAGATTITGTYPNFTISSANTQLSDEAVFDTIADVMVTRASHVGITATDDDAGNGVDLTNSYNTYTTSWTGTSVTIAGSTHEVDYPANITLYDQNQAGQLVAANLTMSNADGEIAIANLPSSEYYICVSGKRKTDW
jgi:hypothetical protein